MFKFFKRKKRRRKKRGFQAAAVNRLVSDWVSTATAIDDDIKAGLTTLRARSRDVCRNNDYGRRFLRLLSQNVVGPNGITLQARIKNAAGGLDTAANDKIEAAWRKFSRVGQCTVDRSASMVDVLNLIVKTTAQDGEIFIRRYPGFKNDFRFALQLIEGDYVDHQFSDTDRRIKMGIQRDKFNAPTKIFFSTIHPAGSWTTTESDRKPVPADKIIHLFVKEAADQARGYPWTTTAIMRMHMVGHYEQSELVAARVGAGKMGFFVSPDGDSYGADDEDDKGNLITDVEPGKFEQLPVGYDFKAFTPEHPTTGFDAFVGSILRGISAGLNVSYASLSNNLSKTNYSSIRHGTLDERDAWEVVQRFVVEHFLEVIFPDWLSAAIMSGQVDLPIDRLDEYVDAVKWIPRKWKWIDPLKEVSAKVKAIDGKIASRRGTITEDGGDPDEVFEQIADETEQFEEPEESENGKNTENRDFISVV